MTAIPQTLTPDSDPASLLDCFAAIHRDQRALCDALERIADSLPDEVDRQDCFRTARALGPLIAQAHSFEEELLFPALSRRWTSIADLDRTLERLSYEHFEDNCFAEELCEALMAYGRGSRTPGPEAFGYMLRGFFEGLRRHIACEEDLIVPLFRLEVRQ